jgi:hypothetical protein
MLIGAAVVLDFFKKRLYQGKLVRTSADSSSLYFPEEKQCIAVKLKHHFLSHIRLPDFFIQPAH